MVPAWADAEWTHRIDEPFRSDGEFWAGLAASADALVALLLAAGAAIALALLGHALWALAPFVPPAALTVRASVISTRSSRRSQTAFADKRAWRDAERGAVASAFGGVLRRRLTRG
jgi:acyl dehydratase